MKIAIASENKIVSQHFGYCETFEIFNTKNGRIISEESLENPGHKPGFLPRFLNENGVNVIISGGMGQAAVDIFNENNIEVIVGAKGLAKDLAKDYLNGELESTGSICHDHNH